MYIDMGKAKKKRVSHAARDALGKCSHIAVTMVDAVEVPDEVLVNSSLLLVELGESALSVTGRRR